MKNTLMIAALIAGSVLAADMAVCAQDATNTPATGARPPGAPGARGRFGFESVATQLGLNDDQKTKAKPIFEDMTKQMAEARKDTSLDRTSRVAKNKEIRDAATAKLKDILTAEQLEKWQKMGQGRRPAGAVGAPSAVTPPAAAASKQ